MRYSTTLSMLSGIAALSSFTMAHPQLVKRVNSPDDTCGLVSGGAGNGYTCTSANTGTCCSQYGYCGSTVDYCGTGCQAAYGTGCTPGGGGGGTDPNLCGPTNGGSSCVTGSCCSANGFCGTTDAYCLPANGCQAAYGICNSTSTGGGGGGGGGDCGPANGNAVCPTGQCCSPAGFCGTTEDYCQSPDCLRGFGTCDSDKTPAGPSTANIPRPLLGSVSYDDDIYDCNDPGHIALTFDDGPYIYTNDLLDKLAAYNFKATFFVTGVNNGKGPIDSTPAWSTVIQRMIADGHQVASHTWSHADLSLLSDADRATEMIKNEMAFCNIMGKFPTWMRPPFSSCNAACKVTLKNLGYHVTYFDLDTQDYLHTTPDTNQISKDLVHGIISAANPANTDFLSIAHDIHEQTVHNFTTYMFDQMVQYGFTGVTAGKCLSDPETNWYRSCAGNTTSTSSSSSSSSTTSSSSSTSSTSSETTTTTSTSTTSSETTTTTSTSTTGSSTSTTDSSTSTTDSSTSTTSSSTSTTSSSTSTTSSSTSTTGSSTSTPSSSTTTTSDSTKSPPPKSTKTKDDDSTKSPPPKSTKTKDDDDSTKSPPPKSTKTKDDDSTKSPPPKPTKTEKTTIPTTPTPAPTSTCAYPQIGNWCCKRFDFTSKGACLLARAACIAIRTECLSKSGLNSVQANQHCGTWADNVCQKLDSFCKNCPPSGLCDSARFVV